jgi:hypothetical protein
VRGIPAPGEPSHIFRVPDAEVPITNRRYASSADGALGDPPDATRSPWRRLAV